MTKELIDEILRDIGLESIESDAEDKNSTDAEARVRSLSSNC